MEKLKIGKRNIVTLVTAILLLIFAFLHRSQLDLENPKEYTGSIFLLFEMILNIITVILFFSCFFILLSTLFRKKWEESMYNFITLVITIAIWFIALQVDSPTLIYMT